MAVEEYEMLCHGIILSVQEMMWGWRFSFKGVGLELMYLGEFPWDYFPGCVKKKYDALREIPLGLCCVKVNSSMRGGGIFQTGK